MSNIESYRAKDFHLSGLNGISDQTLEMHFKLYEGYVSNTNTLNEKIAAARSGSRSLRHAKHAALRRRF